MTNQHDDPIAQIKEAEEKAKAALQTKREDLEKDLLKNKESLAVKTAALETELREKGNVKLETVKKEASEILKSKMATSQAKNNTAITDAKSKQKDGIKEVVNTFMEHLSK